MRTGKPIVSYLAPLRKGELILISRAFSRFVGNVKNDILENHSRVFRISRRSGDNRRSRGCPRFVK